MENKEQTAVEWLVSQQKHNQFFYQETIDQALQMEKEQIVNAVDGYPLNARHLDGEQYYKETYGR